MGRFKRLSIEEASKEFPLLNEEAKKALKGGCRFHEFFGGEHSLEDVELLIRLNGHGAADQKLWVCGTGFVEISGKEWHTLIPQESVQLCSRHPGDIFYFPEVCFYCNADQCGTHGTYFSTGLSCSQCPPQYYCNEHGKHTGSQCGNCAEEAYGY